MPPSEVLRTLRRRPEFIVGPAWVVWLLINCLPITFGKPFVLSVLATALGHGSAGQAFPLTYGLAILLFVYALVVLPGLNLPRRVMVAAAVPFAFTHLYEVPYDLIARFVWPSYYAWATWPIVIVLNLSWLALGLSTVPFWRLRVRGIVALGAVLLTFAAWWIWFFPSWLSMDPPLNPEGSGYMLSKSLLAVFIAIVLWDGRVEPGGQGATSIVGEARARMARLRQRLGRSTQGGSRPSAEAFGTASSTRGAHPAGTEPFDRVPPLRGAADGATRLPRAARPSRPPVGGAGS